MGVDGKEGVGRETKGWWKKGRSGKEGVG